ncbi:MAG: histidine kinase N-terminal 7TM domain-containing protein [Anaerolineales bacterium]|jgi:hypothetical protein
MLETITSVLITLNQILDAGNTITAFSLLLYTLTFNIRERVAQSLALMLLCVTIVYFGDVLTSTATSNAEMQIWLRFQWVGIAFIPATLLQLSDALLAATGRPSRGRRRLVIWISYMIGSLALLSVGRRQDIAVGLQQVDSIVYLTPGPWFPIFTLFLLVIVGFAGVNLWRSYRRCLTRTSRRRMRYLMFGSLGPLFGSFPFMMVSQSAFAEHTWIIWVAITLINMAVAIQMVMVSYSVSYFGVSYPDRVVKSRLSQWLLRGPIVVSTVLAVTVIVNRIGVLIGYENSRAVPFAMVAVLLLLQYVITIVRPKIERWFFYGRDRGDVTRLQLLEDHLLTTGDLRQFLESILNAGCDVLGVGSAFVAVVGPEGLELEVAVGPENPFRGTDEPSPLLMTQNERQHFEHLGAVFLWDVYWLIPIHFMRSDDVIGLVGFQARSVKPDFSHEEEISIKALVDRAAVALADRLLQREVFSVVDRLVPEMEEIQRMRAESSYGSAESLAEPIEDLPSDKDVVELVRDALGHYWGGPRLTRSPLLGLRVVRREVEDHENNPVNALRAILRRAIEQIRPEGDRRFTAEWMLYNILEMKFLQGRKVRDVAMRLAMSEADLYRKQRIAIEEVARGVTQMEREVVASELGGEVDDSND